MRSDELSVGRPVSILPAIRLERTICDLYGLAPTDAPDHARLARSRRLGPARAARRADRRRALRDPADYEFLPVHGEGLHQIPVGPVHAGIIEPGHFRFTANGETVARLEERLGYVHKGIDGLLTGVDLAEAARVVARRLGRLRPSRSSFAFARAVEAALGIDVAARAPTCCAA